MSNRAFVLLVMVATVLIVGAQEARAQPAPLISSPTDGTMGLDSAAALTLAWTTVPGATVYDVELSESPAFDVRLPLKESQIAAQAGRLGQSYLVAFTDDSSFRPGRKYYWRVIATIGGNRVSSEIATFTTQSDPFGWLADHNFSLTRAEDGVDKDKPATIGFIRQGGENSSQQVLAEFLFGWEGNTRFIPKNSGFAISPYASFAGKMTSDKQAEDTLAKVAGGLAFDLSMGQAPTHSLYQTVDVSYEGDQGFGDANLLVEYLITYSGPVVGRFLPASAAAPFQLFVRPYFLTAFDFQSEPAPIASELQRRVGGQLDAKVRLNALARLLGVSGSLLSITDRWYSLSGYERNAANYVTLSLDIQIAKGFSFGYSFKRGRDAPTFKGVNKMALTLGIGFGG